MPSKTDLAKRQLDSLSIKGFMPVNQKLVQLIKSNTFILSSLPVLSVALSFIFEAGFISYYGVPYSIVYIDINKIVIALSLISISAFMVWQIFDTLKKLFFRSGRLLSSISIALIPSSFFALLFLSFEIYTALWLCLTLFLFVAGYTYWILGKPERLELTSDQDGPTSKLAKETVFYFILIAISVNTIGYRQAADKTSYFVTGTNEALIEIYGDKAVTAGFDEKTGTLTGKINIFQINESGLSGEIKKTGKLKKAKHTPR